jgi:hypothetical protein
MAVAMIALLVAFGGAAGAAGSAAVPLAKRALVADRAKTATTATVATTAKSAPRAKTAAIALTTPSAFDAGALGGVPASDIKADASAAIMQQAVAQSPPGARPATTMASVWRGESDFVELGPAEEGEVVISCGHRQAVHGGFQHVYGYVLAADSHPTDGGTAWRVYLINPDEANAVTAAVHVVCLH